MDDTDKLTEYDKIKIRNYKTRDYKKEIERLRKALKFYGKHLDSCCYGGAMVTSGNFVADKDCDCGFKEALKDK